jgi:5-methylcytosine-specific restriction endonuclease McrA
MRENRLMSVRRILIVTMLAVVVVALPASAYAGFYYPPPPTPPPPVVSKKPAPQPTDRAQFGLRAPTYVPPGVNSQGVYTTPLTPGSKNGTSSYKLDWTIGVNGKSGCLVCHGDPNLRRIERGIAVSLYVDTLVLDKSAHAKLLCTDCHVDFAYKTPHPVAQAGENWRTVAKGSCGQPACHPTQFLDWAKSSHSTAGSTSATSTIGRSTSSAPGKPRPQCGDCHAGHTVPAKNDAAGKAAVQASAIQMCGTCHVKATATYDDYYHGAAYRRGAADAPACWTCHRTHLILPSANLQSSTNPDNLVETCSQCHQSASEPYVNQYSPFIHTRQTMVQKNPIMSVVDTATTAIENAFHSVLLAFGKSGS